MEITVSRCYRRFLLYLLLRQLDFLMLPKSLSGSFGWWYLWSYKNASPSMLLEYDQA